MRKITPVEIEQLYLFTQKHYVEFYDLQTELVDHLASAMEENWEKEPALTYEENLQREFKKFGVFGFSEVMKKKATALEKRYFRLIWREMKLQLNHLKILISLFLLFSGILILLEYSWDLLNFFLFGIYAGFIFFFIFKTSRELKRKKKAKERIYLLEHFILNTSAYLSLSYLPFQVLSLSDINFSMHWVQLLIAFLFSLLIYVEYICLYVIPEKRDLILKEQYPELKL